MSDLSFPLLLSGERRKRLLVGFGSTLALVLLAAAASVGTPLFVVPLFLLAGVFVLLERPRPVFYAWIALAAQGTQVNRLQALHVAGATLTPTEVLGISLLLGSLCGGC